MKTSLEHLPEEKQRDIRRAAELILEAFPDEVDMIVLFGSYARGDWVEELGPDGVFYQYRSDYDIMVIMGSKLGEYNGKWDHLRDTVRRACHVPVTLIKESHGHFNARLTFGFYFYVDIVKEGVLLYDSGRTGLAKIKELTHEEARKKAEDQFACWFTSGVEFYAIYEYEITRGQLKIAAFLLHQAAEHLYTAFMLVLTDYKPKTHDLEELEKLASAWNVKILKAFPKGTKPERDRFELLRQAYVAARYEPSWTISREDLDYLSARVAVLRDLVKTCCEEKIKGLKT